MKRLKNVDMKKYTSFKAGGRAAEMVEPESIEDVMEIMREIEANGKKYIILGNGSNTLVKDEGFSGIVINIGENFGDIGQYGEDATEWRCGSGALVSTVAKFALAEDMTGFEFASGIPGSMGGAVFMNAGAYGGEMKDVVKSVEVVRKDGSGTYTLSVDELDLSYRHSSLQTLGDVVVSVNIKLKKGNHDEIAARMKELAAKRNAKQPVNYPSAGSFFKRPEGYFAGKLIEDAGLKGLSVGGAQVSDLHSGFIINRDNATATDIIELMHLVQNIVYDKYGVHLEPEVRIIGD